MNTIINHMNPDRLKTPLLAAIALAVALSPGFLQAGPAGAPENISPIAGLGGSFILKNQRSEIVSEKTFIGKPTLYFFGYTHCPEACPTTLYELSERLKELGEDGNKLNMVFVTVDPARDSEKALAEYMSAFDPRITALTGTQMQIDAMAKAYHVYVEKIPLDKAGYNFNHTATIYAADAQGRVVMLISYGEDLEMVRTKLRRLLGLSQSTAN